MTTEEHDFIESMYHEMYEFLLSYALSSLENRGLAEEAVQETFRIACLKSGDLYNSPNPKGWLTKALKNTICNIKHNRAHARSLLQAYIAVYAHSSPFYDEINLDLVYENLSHLDEFQLIKEMAVEGRSHLEMANKRGISVTACKKRVERAKKLLKKKL